MSHLDINLRAALKALRAGHAVVYPTDTAYGLGVDASNLSAVRRLYKIKGRSRKPTHVVVANLAMAKRLVVFSKNAELIFKKFLPGPLTLVLPLRQDVSPAIRFLAAGGTDLGIRMPDNDLALSLSKKLDQPLATSSANPQGGPTPYDIPTCQQQFKNKKYQPDYYLAVGRLPLKRPSTVIRLVDNQVELLRRGPISKKTILEFLQN